MKCSHCGSPVALRSRHCPKCGAPQDITARHRQELDANIGAVIRAWVLDGVKSRVFPDVWKNATPYEQMTLTIDYVAGLRRQLKGDLERRSAKRPSLEAGNPFVYDRSHATFHEIMEVVYRFVEQARIDHLLAEIERVLRDERYDLEHERVMSKVE